MNDQADLKARSTTQSKKAYCQPKLSNYGSVSRVTRGGMFIGNDGNTNCVGNANPTMTCGLS